MYIQYIRGGQLGWLRAICSLKKSEKSGTFWGASLWSLYLFLLQVEVKSPDYTDIMAKVRIIHSFGGKLAPFGEGQQQGLCPREEPIGKSPLPKKKVWLNLPIQTGGQLQGLCPREVPVIDKQNHVKKIWGTRSATWAYILSDRLARSRVSKTKLCKD